MCYTCSYVWSADTANTRECVYDPEQVTIGMKATPCSYPRYCTTIKRVDYRKWTNISLRPTMWLIMLYIHAYVGVTAYCLHACMSHTHTHMHAPTDARDYILTMIFILLNSLRECAWACVEWMSFEFIPRVTVGGVFVCSLNSFALGVTTNIMFICTIHSNSYFPTQNKCPIEWKITSASDRT